MIERTGDPKGEVWYHARSALIQAVSSVSFEQFMASFNTIVSRAAATDSAFYEERGVKLHSLEVTSYECADAKTAGVLQAIIQETVRVPVSIHRPLGDALPRLLPSALPPNPELGGSRPAFADQPHQPHAEAEERQ